MKRWKAAGVAVAAIGAAVPAVLMLAPPSDEPPVGELGKDVMWVATAPTLVERMLDMAKLTPADFLVDLGSGDGVIVIAAAKRGARALGIEYNPDLVELSRRRAAEAGVGKRAAFVRGDLFQLDLSAATVITMYLTDELNMRLRPRLLALKPGTRIVSQPFRLGDWAPDASVTVTSFRSLLAPLIGSTNHCFFRCSAYLWVVPARVAGRWRTERGILVLRQSYQKIGGELDAGAGPVPLAEAKLSGRRISFRAGRVEYAGQVGDGRMTGVTTGDGASRPWRAELLSR
jgi:SAM-dependent methyltransferase